MKAKYQEESGSTFDEASDIAIRLKVLAGEIYNAQVNFEWLKNQMFAETATGEYLDYIASQRGLTRKSAVKAQGEITFYITEATDHDIIIPEGTVVATADSEPMRFCTTEDEQISAGNTLVSVYAEAEKAGSAGNIAIGKAVIPVNVPAEVESVSNREAYVGGEDAETDSELRERIRDTFTNQSNGTNKAYYEQLALSIDGIAKAGVVPRVRGTGTVNIYVCGREGAADEEALQKLQELVDEERELNVDVLVLDATFTSYDLTVSVVARSGYTNEEVIQKCTQAFQSYIKSLPIGAKLYLSAIGKVLLETGCIENYEFDVYMDNLDVSASQCITAGNVEITVT
ncbi:MAG: baseplate J/gp47 family protein [Ruminococcus sp.]|nr:baseplate J/gp47 family protein [Ruminococcus sp.]